MPLPIRSCPFDGTVAVAVPPKAMPMTLPFQVPAVIVPNEALPKPAAPEKVDVPETVSAVIDEVVNVPWPPWAILSILLTLSDVVAFKISAENVPETPPPVPVRVVASIVPPKILSHLIAAVPRSETPVEVAGIISTS